jgi:hypothetical protein
MSILFWLLARPFETIAHIVVNIASLLVYTGATSVQADHFFLFDATMPPWLVVGAWLMSI